MSPLAPHCLQSRCPLATPLAHRPSLANCSTPSNGGISQNLTGKKRQLSIIRSGFSHREDEQLSRRARGICVPSGWTLCTCLLLIFLLGVSTRVKEFAIFS